MNNMTMMNNATAIQLSTLSRGGVTDDWTFTVTYIAYGVLVICLVLKLIILIGFFFTKKDRTEDKECKKDEDVGVE